MTGLEETGYLEAVNSSADGRDAYRSAVLIVGASDGCINNENRNISKIEPELGTHSSVRCKDE